jgi:hypothetical protein
MAPAGQRPTVMSVKPSFVYCLIAAGLLASGCQRQAETSNAEGTADREAARVEIPAGTHFWVRVTRTVDSAKVKSGDVVKGVLSTPVIAAGREVLPAGTGVDIRVTNSEIAQEAGSAGVLTLELAAVRHQGDEYPIKAEPYRLATAPVQQDVEPGRLLPHLPLTERQGRANAVLEPAHTLVIAITEPLFVKP